MTAISKKSHPTYEKMAAEALKSSDRRHGLSRTKIFEYITSKFEVSEDEKSLSSLSRALKRGLESKIFEKVTGIGLGGSFRLVTNTHKPVIKKRRSDSGKSPARQTTIKPKKAVAMSKSSMKKNATMKSLVKKGINAKSQMKESVSAKSLVKKGITAKSPAKKGIDAQPPTKEEGTNAKPPIKKGVIAKLPTKKGVIAKLPMKKTVVAKLSVKKGVNVKEKAKKTIPKKSSAKEKTTKTFKKL